MSIPGATPFSDPALDSAGKKKRGKIVTHPKLIAMQKIISAIEELKDEKDREWVVKNVVELLEFPLVDSAEPPF